MNTLEYYSKENCKFVWRTHFSDYNKFIEAWNEMLLLGQAGLRLILEPGDATHYELIFVNLGQRMSWLVFNENLGTGLYIKDGEWSPLAVDTWLRDVGADSWNPCTLCLVAQLLEDLTHGSGCTMLTPSYYDFGSGHAIVQHHGIVSDPG